MDHFLDGCQGLGLALAAGMAAGAIAGALDAKGALRAALAALAVVGAAIIFGASIAHDHPAWPGWIAGAAAAAGAFRLTAAVVAGAASRGSEGQSSLALAGIVVLGAAVLAGLSFVISPVSLVVLAAMLWLAISRRRRRDQKYEGLRVLR